VKSFDKFILRLVGETKPSKPRRPGRRRYQPACSSMETRISLSHFGGGTTTVMPAFSRVKPEAIVSTSSPSASTPFQTLNAAPSVDHSLSKSAQPLGVGQVESTIARDVANVVANDSSTVGLKDKINVEL
jgi:hypothetical protein